MSTYDLGDPVGLSVNIRDIAGALANAGAVTLTITLPDGTTASPTVTNSATGVYTASYSPTVVGLHGVLWTATGANASAYRDSFTVLAAGVPLISLDEAKARLNITDTDNDEELRRIAAAATARLAAETHRTLASVTQTATVDMTGLGRTIVTLPKPCWLSITSVTDDGASVDADDWRLDQTGQSLTRRNGLNWTGEVVVTGRSGVAGDDLAIAQQAVLELTAHLWETQRTPMGRNAALAGPVPGMGYALPNRVSEMIAPLVLPGGFA